ncbi:hypothetical protein BJ973_004226 [Actinoplanes tereljensis]|uniref:RICIN domain-containing protein n=1 Tax=Paractinoplanes tereljensis TaxID=571912 RepID=UPI0019434ECE|nr:RICIN domain-containing protein [Actinoplanes tereljensis]
MADTTKSRARTVLRALLTLSLAAAAAPFAGAAAAPAACPASRAITAGAVAAARTCGGPVEALDRRTNSSRTVIAADGSATVEQFAAPRWVQRADGSWTDLDTGLHFAGDTVVPGATLLPVAFSAGGSTEPLATLADGDRSVALSWPAALPEPVLAGATATYPEVLPDVDLQVTALADGFSEVLVVKNAQAAANPALTELGFGMTTTGVQLKSAADGGVTATDSSGNEVFTSPRALMWDSAQRTPRVRKMGERIAGRKLHVAPDRNFLTDPATKYPVYLDPTFTGGKSGNAWSVVASRSDLAGSAFWQRTFMNNSATYGDAGAGATCDSYSGNTCTSALYKVRSMFRMETYGAAGATVLSSNFEITQKWSWTCNTASNAKLWVIAGAISSGTTWNNQPAWDGGHTAQAAGNHAVGNANGCAGPGTVSFDTTGMVQYAYSQGWGDLTLGLQAVNEGTNQQWKRFDSATAVLHIRYDHAPDTPALADLKVGPAAQTSCGLSAASPTRVSTANGLKLSAVLTDADAGAGDLVKAEWSVTGIPAGYAPAPETAGMTSGSVHQTTIPAVAFADGAAVSWQVRGVDNDSNMAGGLSPACYLLVDNTAPLPPGLTSTDLALRIGPGIPPPPAATAIAGQTARVTLTPDPADAGRVVGYRYGVTPDADAQPTSWVAAGPDGTATAAIVPPAGSISYDGIVAQAVKADGTAGATTAARFLANAGTAPPKVTGDATGDGRADLTVASDVGGGRSAFWRWDSTPSGALAGAIAPQLNDGAFANGSFQTAHGDFDGDGLSDVATLTQSGSNVLLGVQRSDGNALLSSVVLRTLPGWSLANIKMVAGDFDGNGRADVAALYNLGNAAWEYRVMLSASAGLAFGEPSVWHAAAPGQSDWNRIKIVAGDMNGDRLADVAEFYDYGSEQTKLWMHYSTGFILTTGAMQWDSTAGGFAWSHAKFVAGDFTGDGKSDVAAFYDYNSSNVSLLVFTAKADGTMNGWSSWWNGGGAWSWNWPATEPAAGDYNGDGRADVGLVYHCCGAYQTRAWTVSSTGAAFGAAVTHWSGATGPVGAGSLPPDNPDQKYEIRALHSGRCLDVFSAGTGENVRVQQWGCSGVAQQRFTLHVNGGGQAWIEPAHTTGKCLGVPGGPLTNGAQVDSNSCGPQWQNLQLWYQSGGQPGVDAVVSIRPMYSGSCFDVIGAGTADGVFVQQWACTGVNQQLFTLHPVA